MPARPKPAQPPPAKAPIAAPPPPAPSEVDDLPAMVTKGAPPDNARHGPWDGMEFFGHVAIEGSTGVMTVTLKDMGDNALWSRKLEPRTD